MPSVNVNEQKISKKKNFFDNFFKLNRKTQSTKTDNSSLWTNNHSQMFQDESFLLNLKKLNSVIIKSGYLKVKRIFEDQTNDLNKVSL